jgi:hypothetical protein
MPKGKLMRVIVCGGRDRISVADREMVWRRLSQFHKAYPITELMQGGASGVDRHAAEWGFEHPDMIVRTFAADWTAHGRAAGPIRNQAMFDRQPNAIIVFPGGNGTANMTAIAERALFSNIIRFIN